MKRIATIILTIACVIAPSFAQIRGIAVRAKDLEPQIVLPNAQVCDIYSIAYSPDGKYIAAGYSTNEVRIWDAKAGTLVKTLTGHKDIVWSVAFSPDSKTLVSGSADKTIKCWDVATGKELRTMTDHTGTVSFVVYSTDGEYIASGSADKTIKFWDPVNGRLLQTLTGHKKLIASIAYSHNGKFMASGSWDNTIKIYYAVGGAEIMTLSGHSDYVFAVAFSPDGKYLASGSRDHSLRIWDVQTGKEERRIEGYSDAVWSVAYSPDGKCIAGSSADGMVKIWDASSGKELHSMKGHVNPVRSLNYNADGTYLSSGDSGGVIKIWNTATGECLATTIKNKDGEWVTYTPEGYLTGSEWALKNLSYTVKGKNYSIAQIYDKVYRPDLVAAKLIGDNIEKEAEKSSLSTIIMRGGDMPDVSFTMQRDPNQDRDVNVTMRIKNVGGGIGKVLLKLNDRAFLVADGIPCKVGQTMTLEYPISLRNGENTVAVTAYESTGMQESAINMQKISWAGKTEKPRLFILAVAVNDYLDPNISKLKNCVADAKGIIDTFTQYSGDLYSDVFVQMLADKDVTKDNLDKTFAEIGKQVKPDDVFILYLAGHGKTYTDGDYYYIPYDLHYASDESIPKEGVSKWELIKDMSCIPAANMMILLDTCNSGSFVSDPKERQRDYLNAMDKDAIIERFAAKAGYDLLAACSTYQYAMDDYNGHGIFTYHVIEALEGYADLNKDKRVTSTELCYYVITEVPLNSFKKWGYEQDPQRILVNLDFPVVGVKNPKEARSLKKELEAPPAAAAAAPPPAPPAPSEAAVAVTQAEIAKADSGRSNSGTIVLPRFATEVSLLVEGTCIQGKVGSDGTVSYEKIPTGHAVPVKFLISGAESSISDATITLSEGETTKLDIPSGRFTIPLLAEGSSVSIQGNSLSMEGSPAFRSPPLPVGTYEVTIVGEYPFKGKIEVDAMAENELTGYRDSIVAKFVSDRSGLQKSLSNKKTKTTWGIVSLSTGIIGAAGTAGIYILGTKAATAYAQAVDTASLTSSHSQVELYGNLLPVAATIGALGLGLSPILFFSGPDPKTVQHSIDSLDAQILALKKP